MNLQLIGGPLDGWLEPVEAEKLPPLIRPTYSMRNYQPKKSHLLDQGYPMRSNVLDILSVPLPRASAGIYSRRKDGRFYHFKHKGAAL